MAGAERPLATYTGYLQAHEQSLLEREAFWSREAQRLRWEKPFSQVVREDLSAGKFAWFVGGALDPFENVVGAHASGERASAPALVFLSSDGRHRRWSFGELRSEALAVSRALAAEGLRPGDRVAFELANRPEAVTVLLACLRLGLTAVPLLRHMSSRAVADRVADCGARLLVTDAEDASWLAEAVAGVRVVSVGAGAQGRLVEFGAWVEEGKGGAEADVPPSIVDSEHPMLLLYSQASAGRPKALVFAAAGYLVQAAASFDYIFCGLGERAEPTGVLCTVDLPSAAGLCYGLFGPLLHGECVILREGDDGNDPALPTPPDTGSSVSLLTTPRRLGAWGASDREWQAIPRFSVVASCGDVLSPRTAAFAGRALVADQARVVNLWIQTESGAAVISSYPHPELGKPGALGLPFLGVAPKVVGDLGQACAPNQSGQLVFDATWPSLTRGLWKQEERFRDLYLCRIPGHLCTNDGVRVDLDGFFWFMKRLDDVIKVKGHSVATSEVEALIAAHPEVEEAVVVGLGRHGTEEMAAFVVPRGGAGAPPAVTQEGLQAYLTERAGEYAVPSRCFFIDALPRAHSGKVLRPLLRRIASGSADSGEDLSHVTNPEVVARLMGRSEESGSDGHEQDW